MYIKLSPCLIFVQGVMTTLICLCPRVGKAKVIKVIEKPQGVTAPFQNVSTQPSVIMCTVDMFSVINHDAHFWQ